MDLPRTAIPVILHQHSPPGKPNARAAAETSHSLFPCLWDDMLRADRVGVPGYGDTAYPDVSPL